jgi:hypothetical protein
MAVLPPLTIGFVEKVALNTTHFGTLIGSRFTGGSEGEAIMERVSPAGSLLVSNKGQPLRLALF